MDDKLKDYLNNESIKYREYPHQAVFTVAESKSLKKEIPGLHCKCLFLKDELNQFYLVAMPADKRLNFNELRRNLNISKMHFASEKELFEILRLTPGSVSIFGMINDYESKVKLILDRDVWSADYVGFHPNINTSTLVISHRDLERFYNSINGNKSVMYL